MRTDQRRQRRLREDPASKVLAKEGNNPSDETPAEETVRGIEKVIATTFVKLNRTIAFKKRDDETFDHQEKQASDLVANHEQMVEESKACVKNEEVRVRDARLSFSIDSRLSLSLCMYFYILHATTTHIHPHNTRTTID